MILGLDFETCSAADLKRVGAWQYSCHPSTRVHCTVFVLAKSPTERATFRWTPVLALPEPVRRHIDEGGPLLAHNTAFERSIIRNTLQMFPWPGDDVWHDTAALAAAANLPTSLAGLAKVLSGTAPKDMEGNAVMRAYHDVEMRPDGTFVYPVIPPDDFERIFAYCEQDVHTMLDCYFRVPKLTVTERMVWLADQRINFRGVHLDVKRAAVMAEMAEARAKTLNFDMASATALEVQKTSNVGDLRDWLVQQGVTLPKVVRKRVDGTMHATPSAGAEVLKRLANDLSIPGNVRDVIALRLEAGKLTSLAKLRRVPELLGNDGRLRHALHYCGASTGRWASRGFQVHNIPRDKIGANRPIYEVLLDEQNAELLEMLAPDSMLSLLSQLLRSVVVAKQGFELIAGDYSAIEARVLAWLAGQNDVLRIFAAGEDIYMHDAKNIGSSDRQLGKVQRLGLGYGMGARKFAVTALGYGLVLPLIDARRVQQAWRRANTEIVEFWSALEEAFREAIKCEGVTFRAGRIEVIRRGACLHAVLPSGRSIRYWRPALKWVTKKIETVNDKGEPETREFETEEIQFFTPEGGTMVRESTYGGKLAENVTQAVSRDLLGEALVRLEGSGYPVVMHVHDAAASEVPAGTGDVREFCGIMETVPSWGAGLPVAVEGYRDTRFRK